MEKSNARFMLVRSGCIESLKAISPDRDGLL